MEQYTTYTVKSKQDGFIWMFKYHLNGSLKGFNILEGQLSPKQSQWLFATGHFPVNQTIIEQVWLKKLKANFEITIGAPNTSFDAFWDAYAKKVKLTRSKQLWKKLNEATRLKALDGIRRYNNYLRANNGIAKANPDTYLSQHRWEDEF